ncbi:MAG: NAD(P)/FAD-dependent oxidoreductase [Candidatus Rokubacteria bacterium]|nr:NAD(P)/FAD-dependent oxidoreductase [Candidatus Rokubacteria bacterium]
MKKTAGYDGIMIGGGHNAMVCAGYLARAGLRILLIERHLEVGGGLDSHENPRVPGFWHNVHSNNHRGLSDLMWYRDLNIAAQGQEYIRLPVSAAMLTRDHRAIVWYANEPERTAASIARFSPRDAETFLRVNKEYAQMAREIFFMELYAPPIPFDKKKSLLERSALGRQYLEWQPHTIQDVATKLFEHDAVRGMVVFMSVIRGYEMDARGMGMVIPAALASGVNTQMSRGSTHRLAHSLNKMIVRAGVDVVEGQAVTRILVDDGRAAGVRVADGGEFCARRFVASSVNPQQTFLDMVGRERLDGDFATKIEGFRYSQTTPLYTLHLALNERLYWKAAEYDPEVNRAFYLIAGLEGLRDLQELYADCRARRLPRALQLLGAQPAVHDPSQAPRGKCTAFFWQIAPGDLAPDEGGKERWEHIREEFLERCYAHLGHYATNLTSANVLDRFGQTPADIERHLPNMVGGDIVCGEMNEHQVLDRRPVPECSQYRTPIAGLYMCGASTHPGGNITGANGYNAAGVICRDLGIEPWWKPADPASHWEALATGAATAGAAAHIPDRAVV